jgi:hypothetical protein
MEAMEKKATLLVPRIEPRFLDCQARITVDISIVIPTPHFNESNKKSTGAETKRNYNGNNQNHCLSN